MSDYFHHFSVLATDVIYEKFLAFDKIPLKKNFTECKTHGIEVSLLSGQEIGEVAG